MEYLLRFISNSSWFPWMIVMSCILLERFLPSKGKESFFRFQIGQDVFFWRIFSDLVLLSTLEGLLEIRSSFLLNKLGYFLFDRPFDHVFGISNWSFIFQFSTVYLIFESYDYFCHRLFLHRSKIGWEFHKCHHSIKILDVISEARNHPLQVLLFGTLKWVSVVVILAPSFKVMVLISIIDKLIGALNHSNINWKWPFPLSLLISSPFSHRWHHSKEMGGRVNYANTFVLLDVVFKTFYHPSKRATELGFPGDEFYPVGPLARIFFPFRQGWNRLNDLLFRMIQKYRVKNDRFLG